MEDERLDERMVGWLRDGPWDAPAELTESAAAYARAHPRRAPRYGGLRRLLMSGIELTPVPMRPAGHRSAYLGLAATIGIVVIIAGIAGASGLLGGRPGIGPPAGGAVTPSPSSTPVPTTMAPQSLTGGFGRGAGGDGCRTVDTGSEPDIGPGVHLRGVTIECPIEWSDPRLQGTATFEYNADGPELYELETWGTIRLDASGGRWEGAWRGTVGPFGYGKVHKLSGVLIGVGAYEGLRVPWKIDNVIPAAQGSKTVTHDDARLSTTWDLTGYLEPVDTIPPDGITLVSASRSCGVAQAGSETVVEGVTQRRGDVIECSGTVGSDPRLDGTGRTEMNGDIRSDLSATVWGTEKILVAGEVRWAGDWTGTVAAGFTTHRLVGADRGFGPYAGLWYAWTTIGDADSGYVTTGTIGRAP